MFNPQPSATLITMVSAFEPEVRLVILLNFYCVRKLKKNKKTNHHNVEPERAEPGGVILAGYHCDPIGHKGGRTTRGCSGVISSAW